MKKRTLALILALVMVLALAACGDGAEKKPSLEDRLQQAEDDVKSASYPGFIFETEYREGNKTFFIYGSMNEPLVREAIREQLSNDPEALSGMQALVNRGLDANLVVGAVINNKLFQYEDEEKVRSMMTDLKGIAAAALDDSEITVEAVYTDIKGNKTSY